jgi:hypothetical protein
MMGRIFWQFVGVVLLVGFVGAYFWWIAAIAAVAALVWMAAMESRSRFFPRGPAGFIGMRYRTCRTPYCDAPIRHRDHATPRNRGGPTTATNGLGECERCNYTKEAPGWRVAAGDENGVHTAEFVTPTGARYRSTAPPLPGAPTITVSEVEIRIGIALADLHAT